LSMPVDARRAGCALAEMALRSPVFTDPVYVLRVTLHQLYVASVRHFVSIQLAPLTRFRWT